METLQERNAFTIIGSEMCVGGGVDIKKEQPQPITKTPPDDIALKGIKSTPINCVSWPSSAWEDGSRRSAFHPYKPTILTNLQRGNIKASEHQVVIPCTKAAWFENAGRGNIELAQIKRRPVNELDDDDLTALMWSSAYGQCSNAELLIKNGANVDMKGKSMETALHLAAAGGHHEVVKLLISNGAKVNEIDEDGNTPLIYAVYGDHSHAVDELLHNGANMFIANHEGVRPFSLAVEHDCNEARVVMEVFLLEMMQKKMPSSLKSVKSM
ncbi:hypothetical protein GE061_000842 [Apolygus lucorum]|uniref:Uncharacterized protein n=1 Tax=Apolygus lucorum TaxID=248454 RepID=A0A6A4KIM0_APOLU|nr:hypothetical protein GE061_000842 [Apolygus lucorum]